MLIPTAATPYVAIVILLSDDATSAYASFRSFDLTAPDINLTSGSSFRIENRYYSIRVEAFCHIRFGRLIPMYFLKQILP